ncbi:MAG: M20/M25/M40 family metallo-hydrolase [Melioribacteraceae bacterium]|nr:M20/M25/M40 family metallo-hydrolase [Melioribacteraceae bacterium]MCF8352977.1 M20/M25/M40 family metallo-hydrolase [Melioribacteraceae bacterium]MCF8395360.1 M20/M25/M40 family metallo-hydrolase [Melioribacteraceae bacterium]MCF8417838.1 M20/M25/M40 family metallo-hydrolase [Melioribacteraceae bacterium]
MKKPIAALIFFTIISSLSTTFGQAFTNNSKEHYDKIADEIIRSALTEAKGYEWLKELCEIGPRLSGSENSLKAIYWAKEKMESLGFDSVWLQPVMVPHWERGGVENAEIVKSKSFDGKSLNITALGGSIGTSGDGITGHILEVKSFEELHSYGEKAKGKIIFFNRSFDNGLANTFAGYGGVVGQRVQGAVEAAKAGGIGAIVRSVTSKYDNVPHTGVMQYVESVNKVPSVSIGLIDADFLSRAVKNEPQIEVNIKLDCKTFTDAKSFNVIGEIRGSEFPDEVIVVGGHYDSWDKGCGAHDDGAPCLQTMEVLDLFKRLNIQPKRTIRCVFFINEENGTRGAETYGEYAMNSTEIHLAAIESDRGVFTPRGFTADTDSLTLSKLQGWIPVLKKSLIDWIEKGGSGVDVSRIKNAKGLFGFYPDNQRYMDLHHSDNDIFETVHPREMEMGSAAIAIFTYLLSEEGL